MLRGEVAGKKIRIFKPPFWNKMGAIFMTRSVEKALLLN